MDDEAPRTEREWAADKREFVADRRDHLADARDDAADARDVVADARQRSADDRERELEEWEGRLATCERDEGGAPPARSANDGAAVAHERERAIQARVEADERRSEAQDARTLTTEERHEATKRRQADAPPTGLALAFAEIAQHLYQSQDVDAVLSTIARAAVATITGCDMASISVPDGPTFRTLASTDAAATDVDTAQYAAGEGPCLDATEEPAVYAPEFPDPRWPRLASDPNRFGVQSVASFRVASSNRPNTERFVGSLNAYSSDDHAFEQQAQEIGLILAAHASTGVSAVRDRVSLEEQAVQLHQALETRDVIGQATGILMERLRVTPEEAFEILRRASQNLNVKLRLIAESLTETGQLAQRPD
ncbi:MAG TPA: GAF and ANTAR domain-containing protein [Acidimicrobiia bacterium]|nr:GAF and ANTAR domain-containing protein [Acidimicrobiia bacterium]